MRKAISLPLLSKIILSCLALFANSAFSQTLPATQYANSDSAEFYLKKGLLEKQTGRRLESLKNFEKAAQYDTISKPITAELASAYLDLHRYGQANGMFKKLVSLGDESAPTYKQLMILSFQLKQNEDVLLYAGKLKKVEPSEKVAYYTGSANYYMDNYGEAIKFLNEAAKEDSSNADIPYMIGHSYADIMNYKLAIPYFLKAIELDQSKNYWIYELALIYYAVKDDKNSLKYMLLAGEKGFKKDNDYLENLGIAYINLGNLDQGILILDEILKRKPGDINLLNMIAEICYEKGKYSRAIEYWDKILEIDKTNAASLYMIGMCYQRNGDREKGMALCDKAIKMDPSLSINKKKILREGGL